jgi:hypothetical protein
MFLKSKQDYQEKLSEVLNPLIPHYSPGGARLTLGFTGAIYPPAIEELEGFARVLWGLAPYFHGGGTSKEFEEIYLNGLTHGTDPNSSEYWGAVEDYEQALVEMAAIAFGLLIAPEKFWMPLSSDAKSNLVAWLNQANKASTPPNNWKFFPILINVAFKQLGRPEYNQSVVDANLQEINSYYVGDGWYQDGPIARYDYYIAFAIHFYSLIYSVFMSEYDPVNSQLFRERAEAFGKQFLYWFDESGSGVPYGRSLTYRFAQVAFYSACVYAGVEPLALPVMKGIIDRNLEMWWHSHMQDFSGILTIGYQYPNLVMAEAYNAPGSPLWALKSFLLLALDDDHPFWSAPAAAFPAVDSVKYLPKAQMILTHRHGNVIMYPNGLKYATPTLGHIEEKYGKFAYSSKFGFSVRKENNSLGNMAPDSDLVFEIGGLFFGRGVSTSEATEGKIVSHWSPFEGIDVTTELTVIDNYSYGLRHTITSKIACTAYACGFAIPRDAPDYREAFNDTCANILTKNGGCEISGGPGLIIEASPNTNLLYPRTSIPAVKYSIEAGNNKISSYITIFP